MLVVFFETRHNALETHKVTTALFMTVWWVHTLVQVLPHGPVNSVPTCPSHNATPDCECHWRFGDLEYIRSQYLRHDSIIIDIHK